MYTNITAGYKITIKYTHNITAESQAYELLSAAKFMYCELYTIRSKDIAST